MLAQHVPPGFSLLHPSNLVTTRAGANSGIGFATAQILMEQARLNIPARRCPRVDPPLSLSFLTFPCAGVDCGPRVPLCRGGRDSRGAAEEARPPGQRQGAYRRSYPLPHAAAGQFSTRGIRHASAMPPLHPRGLPQVLDTAALDLGDLSQVAAYARAFAASGLPLDALVNNGTWEQRSSHSRARLLLQLLLLLLQQLLLMLLTRLPRRSLPPRSGHHGRPLRAHQRRP